MIKTIIIDAVISKGYNDALALRFNENKTSVQFKIGERIYDKKVPNNHRYINYAVKAFSPLSERIEKMQLKESSRINIAGRLDEENWEDNGQKYSRFVIIAEDIEYASSDGGKTNGSSAPPPQNGNGAAPQNSQGNNTENPSGFIGYDNFNNGGENDFF